MLLLSDEGRSRLWTQFAHRADIHQTAPYTWIDRYPEIFDLAAELAPDAGRILSFGCSTGEELISLRKRFPKARIVGVEINARSRAAARKCVAEDRRAMVAGPGGMTGSFDLIFALSVLQRDPRGIAAEVDAGQLAARYPFNRFDAGVRSLADRLRPGGFLCVANSLYRIEDSSVAQRFEPVINSPLIERTLLGPDGRRLDGLVARTIFRKRLQLMKGKE